MTSISVRFRDGTREFRYPQVTIKEGDVLIHEAVRYRVIGVSTNGDGHDVATVELIPESLLDTLQSEEGAIHPWIVEFSFAATGV